MKFAKALTALLSITLPCAAQQIINGSRTLLGNWDASGAATTKPAKTGTVLPATCGVGEVFFNSASSAGANLYLCAAVNSWTQVQGTGGAGAANFRQAFTNVVSVTLAHNLNTFGVVFACFDNSAPPLWILPKSAALTDANTLSITFASSLSGSCVVNATGGGTAYTAGTGINLAGSTIAVDKTAVPTYLTASTSLSFGSIAQAACAQLTFALTGASPGDAIAPGWPATLEAGLVGNMVVSASNTVAVRLCNLSGATLTPAAQSFRATLVRSFP